MGNRPPDPRYAGVRVDANFFHDDIPSNERKAADRLLELAETMEISMAVPHTVRAELDHPNTPAAARERATRLIYTLDTGMANLARLRLVQGVMQGNALPGRHDKDSAHLYDSALWQCAYFVTCDGRILKKQGKLGAVISDLWVVRPTELVAIYEQWALHHPSS